MFTSLSRETKNIRGRASQAIKVKLIFCILCWLIFTPVWSIPLTLGRLQSHNSSWQGRKKSFLFHQCPFSDWFFSLNYVFYHYFHDDNSSSANVMLLSYNPNPQDFSFTLSFILSTSLRQELTSLIYTFYRQNSKILCLHLFFAIPLTLFKRRVSGYLQTLSGSFFGFSFLRRERQ